MRRRQLHIEIRDAPGQPPPTAAEARLTQSATDFVTGGVTFSVILGLGMLWLQHTAIVFEILGFGLLVLVVFGFFVIVCRALWHLATWPDRKRALLMSRLHLAEHDGTELQTRKTTR